MKQLNEAHLLGKTRFGRLDRAINKFDRSYGDTSTELGRHLFDPDVVNPALKQNALSFYGSYVQLNKLDKIRCLENEVIRDMTMQIVDLKEQREVTANDYKQITEHFYKLKGMYAEGLNK